ncbi:tranport-associated late exocytosis protein [Ceratobasidium sp. AG-Ba]|nr:tranport-associated late exocytosis protein [Ceratobasidium sp. AG-Ba]
MATFETRPYSGDYSGLVTQAAIASVALGLSVTAFELMRRKRRKIPSETNRPGVLGSVDGWEWGYLYQARCWARVPAPALPSIPLAWVRQVLLIREPDLFRLVGADATVYTRFLLGCVCFVALHGFTTLPILLPLHVTHAPPSVSRRSMIRASLSSLTDARAFKDDHDTWRANLRLLSVHCALMWWLSITWIGTLLWICRGAFRLRDAMVQDAKASREQYLAEHNGIEHPHQGWRLRTVMVSDIPTGLRDEQGLAEYFRYYMSKGLDIAPFATVVAPSPGLLSFAVNRLWRWGKSATAASPTSTSSCEGDKPIEKAPVVEIEKVVLVRKTTELASLLERREEVLRRLEHAHIKLASKVLLAVKHKMQNPTSRRSPLSTPPGMVASSSSRSKSKQATDNRVSADSPVEEAPSRPATAVPYTLASPRVRQNIPMVTVKLATPPTTPSRRAIARSSTPADEMGNNLGAPSSTQATLHQSTRTSGATEYYTPVTPTRSSVPPPLPPRPQTSNSQYGIKLLPPTPSIPLTSSQSNAALDSMELEDVLAHDSSTALSTPKFKTPPVSPRTGAAELGYNVETGGSGSMGAYGEGLGLGLPSLGRGARGSVGSKFGRGSKGFGNASFQGNAGDDPLGLARRTEQPTAKPPHQRRPSERPLMEEQQDTEMDEVLVDRRGSRPLRDVFFSVAEESEVARDEAMERNKRLVNAIGPFVYEFGLLNRPKSKSPSNPQSRANSTDLLNVKGEDDQDLALRPPSVPLFKRLSSGSSWFSALSSNTNSRTPSQSTGQTLVNPPAFGFSAQVLRTHTMASEPSAVGPAEIRELQSGETLWDALHSLPREDLDRYQPLIHLSTLFKGRTVPAIDFLTTKLALLSALIDESRSGSGDAMGGAPASTAFVTFKDPRDARRALKELAAHPKNALACVTTPAPDVRDIDWGRAMKSTYTGEFLKDWVVNLGVWGFTVLWIFPVSLFVGLVSIDNLSQFVRGLSSYLSTHRIEKELLSSFLPTLLVALLAILIPLLLLLIAKKAHNIITFSRLHDRILTRYYKFLVCNVIIFFCFGVSALQSFLTSFGQQLTNVVPLVASYIPVCAPFFVGWLIFQTGIHAGLELGLFKLPLIVYPAMVRGATTPRRREFGTRARTFNYYYWLPNHLLVVIITLSFSILNPLILPFALLYFSVALAVFKHQFVHVYRKIYDGNAENIVIRILRYSLDGLMFSQIVLMAVMVLLQQSIQAGLVGTALVLTALTKLYLTRFTRSKFDAANIAEANAACGIEDVGCERQGGQNYQQNNEDERASQIGRITHRVVTWHSAPDAFAYSTVRRPQERRPNNPFKPPPPPVPPRHGVAESPIRPLHLAIPPTPTPRLTRLASWETIRADTPLVVSHTRREPWDDAPDHTATYDNPYYTQDVPEYLWLPKNPLSELDLNDTVNLHRALTSVAEGGDMAESIFTDEEAAIGSYYGGGDVDPFAESVTGREDIALSAVILERVDHGDPGDDSDLGDAESTGTIFSRRPSSGTHVSRRIPSTAFRSFSAGVRRSGTTQAPMSPNRLRSHSVGVGVDPALQPDLNVQAQFLPSPTTPGLAPPTLRRLASQLSIGRSNDGRRSNEATPIRPNRPRANTGASAALSVREALLREVCEEERTAAEERIRQELHESEHLTAPRKWTKWMYSKPASDEQAGSH